MSFVFLCFVLLVHCFAVPIVADIFFCLFYPGLGHFTLSILPILIFGPLSLFVFLVASLSDLACRLVGIQTQEERRRASGDKLGVFDRGMAQSTLNGYAP